MVDQPTIMVAAVVLSIGLMLALAGRIADVVDAHPTVKMPALAFLVLIGTTLVADGFDVHVVKPFIYGPTAFAIIVESLNLTYAKRATARRGGVPEAVQLHQKFAEAPGRSAVHR